MILSIIEQIKQFTDIPVLYYLGLVTIIYIGSQVGKVVYGVILYFLPRKDILRMYGDNKKNTKYCVISGTTEGIGKEYAFQFAKLGFKICQIARNQEKMENTKKQVLERLKAENLPEVEIISYKFDFSEIFNLEKVEEMKKFLQKLNVGIYVNNVGVISVDFFENLTRKDIQSQIDINSGSIAVMDRLQIENIQKQNQKTLIINMSSVSGQFPVALYQVYAASKLFVTRFTEALQWEVCQEKDLKHLVDLMLIKPNFIKTQMTGNKLGITTQQCCLGVINMIGKTQDTAGHWIDQIKNFVVEQVMIESRLQVFVNKIIKQIIGL